VSFRVFCRAIIREIRVIRGYAFFVHRFYISPNELDSGALVLRGAEAHHASDVLRMKHGDKAVLFNGRGREITAEIVDLACDEIRFRKLHQAETPPLRCRITLGQAIPKGKNMDLIVQKAVEIGAWEIAPLISERTIVDIDQKEATRKQAKWQQVAIEAAKQCGQNWLPQIDAPRKLKDFFAQFPVETGSPAKPSPPQPQKRSGLSLQKNESPFDFRLIGSLQSDAQHLKKILADYQSEHRHLPASVLMLIGPEGDFTPAELALAKSQGCSPITLGPIILRVETAAIYCLSVLSYELL
jgi:16S rRNA (uracil1498-N3)-methyltransferase